MTLTYDFDPLFIDDPDEFARLEEKKRKEIIRENYNRTKDQLNAFQKLYSALQDNNGKDYGREDIIRITSGLARCLGIYQALRRDVIEMIEIEEMRRKDNWDYLQETINSDPAIKREWDQFVLFSKLRYDHDRDNVRKK